MKPVSLRLKNFGPFTEEQFIDFASLEKSGLFLIYGNTGSGKTTLLDAICCALYCASSNGVRFGGSGKSTLEKMRCQQAKENEPTYVEFIFDSNGARYRFYREIRLNRGGVNFNEEHTCGRFNGEEFVPLESHFTMDRVTAHAVSIIGLTADQFRQVVILPQGRFEQLLTSDSKDKEEILSGIFNVEKWERITECIKKAVALEKESIAAERSAIDGSLAHFGCVSVAGLRALRDEKDTALAEKKKSESALLAEVEQLEKKKTALVSENERFKALDESLETLAGYTAEMEKSGEEESALARAQAAAKIRPLYDKYAQAKSEAAGAAVSRDGAAKDKESALEALDEAKKLSEAHAAKKAENEEKKNLIVTYKNSVDTYKAIGEKKQAAEKASAGYEKLAGETEKAKKKHTSGSEALIRLKSEFTGADDELRRLRDAYDNNIGSVLAKKLEPGKPCPVCGSTSHPSPAVYEGEEVTKEAVDLAQSARDNAEKIYKEKQDEVEKLKAAADDAEKAGLVAQGKMKEALAAYNEALKGTVEGISSLDELEEAIENLTTETVDYGSREAELAQALTDAGGHLREKEGILKSAEAALKKAQEALDTCAAKWTAALDESDFGSEEEFVSSIIDPDEVSRRRDALTTLKANYKSALENADKIKKELEGRERPDLDSFEKILKQKKKDYSDAGREVTLLSNEVKKAGEEIASLEAKEKKLRSDEEKYDRDRAFCDKIEGKNGVSLKRYVLGIMLGLVTNRANEMLGNIYGGRYKIRKSDSRSGRERNTGLAFEIEDFQCGKCRSSSDISGGEKFLVSLSLAIGLSDVVRAQGNGINLEAIFIDEGFGTLDKECLGDALYVLESVREKNGMVGVISHVEELAENITARIETVKTGSGSRCEVYYE